MVQKSTDPKQVSWRINCHQDLHERNFIPVLFQALHGLRATLQLLLHGVGVDFGLSRRDLQSVFYRLLFQGGKQRSTNLIRSSSGQQFHNPTCALHSNPSNVWCSLLCRDIMYIQYIQNTLNVQLSLFYLWPPAGRSCILTRKHQKTPQHRNSRFFFCKLLIATVHNKQHLTNLAIVLQ